MNLINFKYLNIIIDNNIFELYFMQIWGLGIGDWGLGPIPNPQSPIPNESIFFKFKSNKLIKFNYET